MFFAWILVFLLPFAIFGNSENEFTHDLVIKQHHHEGDQWKVVTCDNGDIWMAKEVYKYKCIQRHVVTGKYATN